MTTTLADHLAQADSWVLGAEHDVREFEKQLTEAERHLATTAGQYNAATANIRAIIGSGPDSVTFRGDLDRQVAAYQAATEARAVKATLQAGRQVIDTLKAKLANRRTDLIQAQALRQRIQLAMQADELPTAVDELEALLELGPQ
ncbi:hypothetical protein ABZT17_25195 [Streptomyces sp. NPDC005648]|uniref:hypothetical protein n=1 Tax=Streptomyces sp. NPDC005648 TaxID=3157044 RepID=UPI0033AC72A0